MSATTTEPTSICNNGSTCSDQQGLNNNYNQNTDTDVDFTVDECMCLFEHTAGEYTGFTTQMITAIQKSNSEEDCNLKYLTRCCNKYPQLCRNAFLKECSKYVTQDEQGNPTIKEQVTYEGEYDASYDGAFYPPPVCSCFYPNWYQEGKMREKYQSTGTDGLPSSSQIPDITYDNADLLYEVSTMRKDCEGCDDFNVGFTDKIFFDGSDKRSHYVSAETLSTQFPHLNSCREITQQPCFQLQSVNNSDGSTFEDSDLLYQSSCKLAQSYSLGTDNEESIGLVPDEIKNDKKVGGLTSVIILVSIMILTLLVIWSFM